MSASSGALPTRRQVLAEIALTQAPMPRQIRFRDGETSLTLELDSSADLRAWIEVLGVPDAAVWQLPSPKDAPTKTLVWTSGICWRGWTVQLDAEDLYQEIDLDETTRAELATVAAGGDPR